MNIQELMTKPVVTCRPGDNLNTAARLMWEHDCGAIAVVADEGGRLAGMITDRDICMSAYTRGRPLTALSVQNAMAKEVFSCRANDSLEAAERLMSDKQIRRVPVVDGENRPIGMISLNDMVRYAASSSKMDGIEREVVETLAAICQPRPMPKQERRAQPRTQLQQHQPGAMSSPHMHKMK